MKIKILLTILCAIILSGCAANDMYYWGSYESTLYNYKTEPNDKSFAKHKQELEKIIKKGQSGKKGVPPGIYFELAMIEAEQGNTERSIELFNQEKNLFPEATKYVDNALKNIKVSS